MDSQLSAQLPDDKHYSSEAVQYILQRAMTHQSNDGFTAIQLQEMAAELNIAPALLQQAALEWKFQQLQSNAIAPTPAPAQRKRRRDNAFVRSVLYGAGGTVTLLVLKLLAVELGIGNYIVAGLLIAGACYLSIQLKKYWKPLQRRTFTRRVDL